MTQQEEQEEEQVNVCLYRSNDDDDDDDLERNPTEHSSELFASLFSDRSRRTQQAKRTTGSIIAVFLSGLLLGLLLSPILSAIVDRATSASRSRKNSQAQPTVSFLETARGAALLQELRKELLWKKGGPRVALEHLRLEMKRDSQVAESCTSLGNVLGRLALREFGLQHAFGDNGNDDNDNSSLLLGTPLLHVCNSAYVHGVIEHHLAGTSSDETILQQDATWISTTVCDAFVTLPTAKWQCQQAIGKGMTRWSRRVHDRQVLEESLDHCRRQENNNIIININNNNNNNNNNNMTTTTTAAPAAFFMACEHGVWMEHFGGRLQTMSQSQFYNNNNNNDDDFELLQPSSLQICSNMASSPVLCATYAPLEYLTHHPGAYVQAIQFCHKGYSTNNTNNNNNTNNANHPPSSSSLGALRMTCVMGVGAEAAKDHPHDYSEVERACLTADGEEEQSSCFGAALLHYTQHTGQQSLMVPASVCRNLEVFRDVCLAAAGGHSL